ncbi:TIGR00153 family protein [bacterium]|nr:TIGR00153 family protein [bacterium]MCK4437234.1 TIGR00153 family protein [bacterium]
MKIIGGILGRSPSGPIHEHMMKVNDCLKLLRKLVKEFTEEDYSKVKEHSVEISRLEHQADMIKGTIRDSLSKSFFSSIERADILSYLKEQDRIADSCEDVAKLMEMRKTRLPEVLKKRLLKLTDKVMEAVEAVKSATAQLKSLEKSSYARNELDKALRSLDLAAKREWEADGIQLDFAKKLFQVEKEMDPISVFFLINISKQIGLIADHAENVADILRRMIIRR